MRDKSYESQVVATRPDEAWPSCQESLDIKPRRKPNSKQQRSQPELRLCAENCDSLPPPEEMMRMKEMDEQAIVPLVNLAEKQTGDAPRANETEPLAKSVISALQEFVQDSKIFRMPMRQSVLQWSFEEHCAKQPGTEFRATVVFVLDGVPHHVLGEWQASKNMAKRDAAERALELFVSQWGSQLLQEDPREEMEFSQAEVGEVEALTEFCRQFPACCQIPPQLETSWDGDACKGVAHISLFGVPHTFAGIPCPDEDTALMDVARRVLWYLQCPGFESDFHVDMDAALSACSQEQPPPAQWQSDGL